MHFRASDKQIVIFKSGNTYDYTNFPQLFNAIQSVKITITANRVGNVEIVASPDIKDGLFILETGALTKMTEYSKKLDSSVETRDAKPISPSFSAQEAKVSGSAAVPDIVNSNMPNIAIKLSWSGETLPNGNLAETPWFFGTLDNPDVSFDAKFFTFTLKGTLYADRFSGVYGTNTYQNQTVKQILEDLAGEETIFVLLDEATIKKVTETKINFAYNDSVSLAIRRLLESLDIIYFISENRYYLRNRSSIYTSVPLYQFVAFRQIDPDKNIYPILEYSCEGLGRLLTGGLALGVLPKAFNTDEKKLESSSFSPSLNDKIKDSVDNQKDKPDSQGAPVFTYPMRLDTQVEGKTPAQNKVENTSKDAVANYLQVNLTTLGIPNIFPGVMVDVRIGSDDKGNGLPAVSGKGMVTEVEHEYSNSGWLTRLKVRIAASVGSAEYKDVPEFDPNLATSEDLISTKMK